jgi:hypothetical protein
MKKVIMLVAFILAMHIKKTSSAHVLPGCLILLLVSPLKWPGKESMMPQLKQTPSLETITSPPTIFYSPPVPVE